MGVDRTASSTAPFIVSTADHTNNKAANYTEQYYQSRTCSTEIFL